jgi:small-conductance mechanosensitive channel
MTLFKPITILHFICCLVLTISIKILWNISFQKNSEIHISDICLPLIGCKTIAGEQKCDSKLLSCLGSKRCCHGCQRVWQNSLIVIPNIHFKNNVVDTQSHIKFSDELTHPIDICVASSCIILFLHILLLITISMKSKIIQPFEKNMKKKYHYSQLIYTVCIFLGIVLIFILSLGSFLYSIGYIIVNFHLILKCQPTFILLVSWCWILFLWLFEFVFDIKPYVQKTKWKHKTHNETNLTQVTYCDVSKVYIIPIFILKLLSRIVLLWWVVIPIYLTGVVYNKWHI